MPLWGEGTFPLEDVKIGGWSAQSSRARWLWGLGLGRHWGILRRDALVPGGGPGPADFFSVSPAPALSVGLAQGQAPFHFPSRPIAAPLVTTSLSPLG